MISSHLCVDPNIELLNGDRNCFKVRFLIDVRGRCVSSHWQLPQPGAMADSIEGQRFLSLPLPLLQVARNTAHLTRTPLAHPHTDVLRGLSMVTICIILERLLDRPRQLPHVKSYKQSKRPKAAPRVTKMDYGRANGWRPKSFRNKQLAEETSLLGTTPSPTAVARAPTTPREIATSAVKFGETSQAGLRFGFNQGSVDTGVTAVAAPSGHIQKLCSRVF